MRVHPILVAFLYIVVSSTALANIKEVHLKWDDIQPAPRWKYGKGDVSPLYLSFKKIKISLDKEDFQNCIQQAKVAAKRFPSLIPWILTHHIHCATKYAQKKGNHTPLTMALFEVSQKPSWLLKGPYRKHLRQAFLSGLITELSGQVEKVKKSNKSTQAWQIVDELQSYSHWLNRQQHATVWQKAGELALFEKKPSLSMQFMKKSLIYKESKKVLRQRRKLHNQHVGKKPASTNRKESTRQTQLLRQMKKSRNAVGIIRAGVELISNYPGGPGASEAEKKIGDTLLKLAKKKSHGYSQVLDIVLKSDSQRLYHWAKKAYRAEMYKLAYQLTHQSYKKMGEWPSLAPQVLQLLGRSAFHSNQWKEAAKFWGLLVEKYSASQEVEEATMRLGMLYYREKKNKSATFFFKKSIAISRQEKYEVISRYWLWRTAQRLNSKQEMHFAQKLMDRFPMTYYGLRARMELAEGKKVKWPQPIQSPLQAQFWLTESEYDSWERFQLLLRVGWFEEAQQELLYISEAKDSAEERVLFGKLFSQAFDHFKGIQIINQVFEGNPWLLSLETVRLSYPIEYWNLIERESQKYNLDPLIVLSLIKQESAFNKKARSAANALGLMQLLEPTAKEMAKRLKKKVNMPKDLFHPPTNIQLGTRYIRQMIRAFNGHIPLALAAYNAGIGHMRIWLRTRNELAKISEQKNSHPDNEMWIDELPWDETSFYVKAILRNYILYKALEKKELVFNSPLWVSE